MKSVLCYPLFAYVEVLQNHILDANCTQVHKQAPNKMAAGAVSMVFSLWAWFWKESIANTAASRFLLPLRRVFINLSLSS